jgi:3-oxoacyl-[acyl-carrier protein] reductase
MIANQYGRIINTSSVVAHYGNFGQTNYAATKGALISFTKSLSKELGKNNITVNAVAPGFIETDIIKTMPEKVLDSLKSASDLKRAGTAEEVANVYLFLASSHASYITGSVINVDGGLSF